MVEMVNKIPRWALTVGFLILLSFSGIALSVIIKNEHGMVTANAEETTKVKSIAYQAKTAAETCQLQVAELRGAIQDLKNNDRDYHQETHDDLRQIRDLILKR